MTQYHSKNPVLFGQLALLVLGAGWSLAACGGDGSSDADASGGSAGADSKGSGGTKTASGGATSSGGRGGRDTGGTGGLGGQAGDTGTDGGTGGDPENEGGTGGGADVGTCTDVECSDNAECVENDNGAACACRQGYAEDETGTCIDIDECADAEGSACGFNAECENTEGSFSCACWPGLVGDPAVLCCPVPPPEAVGTSIALSVGHVDVLAMSYDCGSSSFSVSTKDDTARVSGPVYRETSSVLIHGGPDAALEVPPDLPPEWSFAGSPGDIVWILPQTQIETVVWPGWDTQGVAPSIFDDGSLTMTLSSVEGPGRFVGYFADDVPLFLFDPENGLDTLTIFPSTHVHLNWFFSKPGLYKLNFAITGTIAGGLQQTTAYSTLRFFLGDLAELPNTEPTVLSIEGLASNYAVGDSMNLEAVRYGAPSILETTWLRQCMIDWDTHQVSDWTSVGTGSPLSYVLGEGDFNCQFRAALYSDSVEVATSQSIGPSR